MPRVVRMQSQSNMYHVILRGVNQLAILPNLNEKTYFLDVLRKTNSEQEYELFAYCLMDNHAHLMIASPPFSGIRLKQAVQDIVSQFDLRPEDIKYLAKAKRDAIVVELVAATQADVPHLSDHIGISKSVIYKALSANRRAT